MDIEILAPETLRCYSGLEEQLRIWAELTSIPIDGLLVRMFCGNIGYLLPGNIFFTLPIICLAKVSALSSVNSTLAK
ncbi:unnamed protein product [marine sediment metagenome]|uniref:Uncharacterized protein n=1 Tax=marine sediment metagenome TaxID=412755 RepID=X1FD70_9ZZZZ